MGSTQQQPVEGQLTITLQMPDRQVQIESTRPLQASRLFQGRSVEETLKLLPQLFNVCGQAQAVAAVSAIESALGRPAEPALQVQRNRLVALETLREHLFNVLLDGPDSRSDAEARSRLTPLLQSLQACKRSLDPHADLCQLNPLRQVFDDSDFEDQRRVLVTLIEEQLFGQSIEHWLQQDEIMLEDWLRHSSQPCLEPLRQILQRGWQDIGQSSCPALPELPIAQLRQRLATDDDDSFITAPCWQGSPCETGVTVRQQEHPLVHAVGQRYGRGLFTRLTARLVEIARLLLSPLNDVTGVLAGEGLAQVEAARGRLCHDVTLREGYIQRYRILAPTEWNFCPAGPAALALADLRAQSADQLREQSHCVIRAIDPCVGYELSVRQG